MRILNALWTPLDSSSRLRSDFRQEDAIPPLTDAEIGARIRAAREEAGQSGTAMAKALGVSQPTFSRLESGARRITATELFRIAEVLSRPPEFFLESDTSVVLFRRDLYQDLDPATQEATHWLEDFAARMNVLRDYTPKLKLPRADIPVLGAAPETFEDAEILASELRKRLDLGGAPAPDMFGLVERLGATCVVRPFPRSFEGMYVPRPIFLILINGNQPGMRQRFTLAHELAHHLFDGEGVDVDEDLFGRGSVRDRIANVFAAHFLMPRDGLERELHRRFGVTKPKERDHAYWLAFAYGVSVDALCYQLHNLGMISSQTMGHWKGVTRAALLASLGLDEDAQYRQVEKRWPPEFLRRLAFAYSEGVLDAGQVSTHLEGDVPEGLIERETVPA